MSSSRRRNLLLEHIQQYNGVKHLTDADLLALALCKGGTAREHEKVLKRLQALLSQRSLTDVLSMDIAELLQQEFDAEIAARLLAMMDLARRLMRPAERRYQIRSADDVALLVGPDLRYLDHEEMRVLLLNNGNYVVANLCLYQGTVNSAVMRPAEVFRMAIIRNCSGIIICHNHPSGSSVASPEDIELTKQCVEAGKLLDIDLLDHVIIGNPGYMSLKEKIGW